MTQNIPNITLLCMEDKHITAFKHALATNWPTHPQASSPQITILNTSLSSLPPTTTFNLIVSPANSYGRLDGSFDDAISRAFCLNAGVPYDTLTKAVQKELYNRVRGFLAPGCCELVQFPRELLTEKGRTGRWGCKWVGICPTMRVPESVTWDREVVYECVWNLLCKIEGWNRGLGRGSGDGDGEDLERIETVLMTPLATGCGMVSAERWAAQVVLALKHFVDAVERPERWSQLDWGDVRCETREVKKTWM